MSSYSATGLRAIVLLALAMEHGFVAAQGYDCLPVVWEVNRTIQSPICSNYMYLPSGVAVRCCEGLSCESLIGCYPNPRQKGHPCSLNEPCFGDRCCDDGLKCELPPTPIKPNTGLCVAANPPTEQPTSPMPTNAPTRSPTGTPSELPSSTPTNTPTKRPTPEPTERPSARPSLRPSKAPTISPLEALSKAQSTTPTTQPSLQPIPVPVPAPRPPEFTYKKARFQTCEWLGQLPVESVATICRTRTKPPSARAMCPQTCTLSQINRSAEAENKYLHRKKTKKSCDWLRNRSDRATICSKNKNARGHCASEC